jgi:hypothetical protein
MNRRKQTSSLGFPSLILLGIAAMIVSGGGISFVVLKNKQITARARIAELQKRMDEHQVKITMNQVKIDKTLVLFDLQDLLTKRNPRLRKIKSWEVYRDPEPDSPNETPNQGVVARR